MTQNDMNAIHAKLNNIEEGGKLHGDKDRVWVLEQLQDSLRREAILRVGINTCISHLEYAKKAK